MLTRGTVRPSKTGRGGAASFAWAAALVATLLAVSLVLAPTCLASPASAPAAAPPPAGGSTATSQGAPLSIEDNPTGYVGALQVASTGAYQMGARAYSPSEGRFLTYDLCRPTQNRYAYTGGDPINRVDPTGCSWTWAGVLKFFESPGMQIGLTAVMTVLGLGEARVAWNLTGAAFLKAVSPVALNAIAGGMGVALLANSDSHFMSKGWEEGLAIADTALGLAALGVGGWQIRSNLIRRARVAADPGIEMPIVAGRAVAPAEQEELDGAFSETGWMGPDGSDRSWIGAHPWAGSATRDFDPYYVGFSRHCGGVALACDQYLANPGGDNPFLTDDGVSYPVRRSDAAWGLERFLGEQLNSGEGTPLDMARAFQDQPPGTRGIVRLNGRGGHVFNVLRVEGPGDLGAVTVAPDFASRPGFVGTRLLRHWQRAGTAVQWRIFPPGAGSLEVPTIQDLEGLGGIVTEDGDSVYSDETVVWSWSEDSQ